MKIYSPDWKKTRNIIWTKTYVYITRNNQHYFIKIWEISAINLKPGVEAMGLTETHSQFASSPFYWESLSFFLSVSLLLAVRPTPVKTSCWRCRPDNWPIHSSPIIGLHFFHKTDSTLQANPRAARHETKEKTLHIKQDLCRVVL